MSRIDHPLSAADEAFMTEFRAATAGAKGVIERTAFDQVMEQTADAPGVTYAIGTVDGVDGVWCEPTTPRDDAVVLYVHGGAYVAGSAWAFRHQAGQIAARAKAPTFIPNYRLAPEHPFPAAVDDANAVYKQLSSDYARVAIAGDSAGGGLALVTFASALRSARNIPRACAAMSPWTDLSLQGESMRTRADADPLLTPDALRSAAATYLAGADARDPAASPLFGDLSALPSIEIHVGDAEILLDDARRYADRARAAGVDVTLHVWLGMPHVFQSSVGTLDAASEALDTIGAFLGAALAEAR